MLALLDADGDGKIGLEVSGGCRWSVITFYDTPWHKRLHLKLFSKQQGGKTGGVLLVVSM